MKSIHIAFFNVFIVILSHLVAFIFLNKYATQAGACGMGVAIIAGSIPLMSSFICSSVITYFITKINQETYLQVILWYAIFGIFCHSIIAYLAESYLWALLIIPYLLFIGQSFYLKYENKFDNQSEL